MFNEQKDYVARDLHFISSKHPPELYFSNISVRIKHININDQTSLTAEQEKHVIELMHVYLTCFASF